MQPALYVVAFGHPIGADPKRSHLFAPIEFDAARVEHQDWTDRYTSATYRITTIHDPTPTRARVTAYRDTINAYRVHPEPKSSAPSGEPCGLDTIGLLGRRSVHAESLTYVGKESNDLEDVAAGLAHDEDDILNEYRDPQFAEMTIARAVEASHRERAGRPGSGNRRSGGGPLPVRRTLDKDPRIRPPLGSRPETRSLAEQVRSTGARRLPNA